MSKENLNVQKSTKSAWLQKLNLERKKSPVVTDEEVGIINKLVKTEAFYDEAVDIVRPSLSRNPTQEQVCNLMKYKNNLYSGTDSLWVGIYRSLEDTPKNRKLGEKIIRAAAQIIDSPYAEEHSDYSLMNFYNRISTEASPYDCFESVSNGLVENPKMIPVMLEELNKKMKAKEAKDYVIDDDVQETRDFLMRVISVSKFPEGSRACADLMDTLHKAEKKLLKENHDMSVGLSEEQKLSEVNELKELHANDAKILSRFSSVTNTKSSQVNEG